MKKMLKMLSLICVATLIVTVFAVIATAGGSDAGKLNITGVGSPIGQIFFDSGNADASKAATDEYVRLVDLFTAISRTYDTLDERSGAALAVESYLGRFTAKDGTIHTIDTESAAYQAASAQYQTYSTYLDNDKVSYDFVVAMNNYKRFDSYSRKVEYYGIADAIARSCELDRSISEDAGETRLDTALAAYSKATIEVEAMIRTQNSKYFVMYMEYTQNYDGVESWEANYNLLKYPVNKAREIVRECRFDPNYEGVTELLLWYEPISEYFYERLQDEHISYIGGLLEKYTLAEAYIEKLGICIEADNYIKSAEIDPDNVTLQRLIEKTAEYLAEIATLEEPYRIQKHRQTDLFMYAVKKLEASNGYEEIREYLAEATEHYYRMTVGATDTLTEEQVLAAIAKYDYYTEYADKLDECSESFKLIVASLSETASYSERYLILVEAVKLVEYISEDIEGVSEAYEEYAAAYEDYAALTATASVEIQQTQEVFTSARLSVASVIVTFFAKLIGLILD